MTLPTPPLDDLYHDIILDHYKNPRFRGELDESDGHVEAANPVCGDEIELAWRIREGKIEAVQFTGKGCSISQAAASMLCDSVHGKSPDEALKLLRSYKAMLVDGAEAAGVGDLEALQGVRVYPVRVKCATLAANGLFQALGAADEIVSADE